MNDARNNLLSLDPVPSREEAIQRLVELDVLKWGEQERAASMQMRRGETHGLALNALAVYDLDMTDEELAARIKKVEPYKTAKDVAALRSGG